MIAGLVVRDGTQYEPEVYQPRGAAPYLDYRTLQTYYSRKYQCKHVGLVNGLYDTTLTRTCSWYCTTRAR